MESREYFGCYPSIQKPVSFLDESEEDDYSSEFVGGDDGDESMVLVSGPIGSSTFLVSPDKSRRKVSNSILNTNEVQISVQDTAKKSKEKKRKMRQKYGVAAKLAQKALSVWQVVCANK